MATLLPRATARLIASKPVLDLAARAAIAAAPDHQHVAASSAELDHDRHDYFNLAVTPLLIVLCIIALAKPTALAAQRNFTMLFAIYNLADVLWIVAQPTIVGAPAVLIGHHIATLACLAYCLWWAPHTRFAAWMGIVEVTTFLTILKRHVDDWPAIQALVELLFKLSWLLIRMLWIGLYIPFHFAFRVTEPFPAGMAGIMSKAMIYSVVSALAALQFGFTAALLKKQQEKARSGARPSPTTS